jgi:hypothetical protein
VHTCCGDLLHEEPQIQIPDRAQPDRGRFNFALVLAVAAVLIILVALFAWPGRQSPPGAAPQALHLPFGPEEQAYAPRVHLENITLSRAENFLHQEVTTLSGELLNTGDRALRGADITIEFFDDLNQIALREQRAAIAPGAPPLAPGERRSFEVSFEHISSSWNRQQPLVRVTGLQF